METRRETRISKLMQALRRNDKIHLKQASSLLGVSEMTIRRDLSAAESPVALLGGYVVLQPGSNTVSRYQNNDQQGRQLEEKRNSARRAAALVKPHQTLFFDCGTTTPWIIDALDDKLPFTGICYSLNTFLALQEKPACRVILCGGEFHASNAIFKPLDINETLANLCPDIAFISAAGVHPEYGATCFNLDELPVKHWALRKSRLKVLVVDGSKFGQVRPACIGELSAFDTLISDAPIPPGLQHLAAK